MLLEHQNRVQHAGFDTSLEQTFWVLPRTQHSVDCLAKARVPGEAIIDPALLLLPKEVNASELILLDQVIPRVSLGTGVGAPVMVVMAIM